MSEDYGQKIIDAVRLAAFSVKDQRELDTLKAANEMPAIAAEMMAGIAADKQGLPAPEELMRREAELIAKWPEACRRAGVGAMPIPDEFMRAITSFVGRAISQTRTRYSRIIRLVPPREWPALISFLVTSKASSTCCTSNAPNACATAVTASPG
jgi:hypothetical protein